MNERSRVYILGLVALALAATAVALLLAAPQAVRAANINVGTGGDHATIQAAIDAANPGDVLLVRNETFTESLVITKSLTLEGGYAANFADRIARTTTISGTSPVISITGSVINVTVDGFEIKDGTDPVGDQDGAGIYVDVDTDSSVVIHDNYVHDNDSGERGGAIWADVENRSDLAITANSILSNTAHEDGGGIWAEVTHSSTLTLNDNWIENNESWGNGAGFFASVGISSTFEVMRNTVKLNMASTAGGLWFQAQNHTHGSFDHNDVISNVASAEDEFSGHGGAYVEIDLASSTTFHNNEFRGNEAADDERCGGLGMRVDDRSSVTGSDLVLRDNEAEDDFGGAWFRVRDHSTVELDGVEIVDNEANDRYGGAYFELGNYEGDSYGDHSSLILHGLQVLTNEAGSQGGAGFDIDNSSRIEARDSEFQGNSAGDAAGAWANINDDSTLDLGGSSFVTNTSTGEGGGLYLSGNRDGSTLLLDRTSFLTNTAEHYGGGLYVSDETLATDRSFASIAGSEFISNTANDSGGAIYSSDHLVRRGGSLVLSDTLFLRNTANYAGGAIYVDGDLAQDASTFIIQNTKFVSNTAEGSNGGAIYIYSNAADDGSTATILNTQFVGNVADGRGGAIYQTDDDDEDALAMDGSQVTIQDSQFLSNTAKGGDGGAIRATGGAYKGSTLHFLGNTLRNNEASDQGGGIYVRECDEEEDYVGLADDGSTVLFNGNTIEGNRALSEDEHPGQCAGGGAYLGNVRDGSYAEFVGNTIVDNVAHHDGGGLCLYEVERGSHVVFSDNLVSGNVITESEVGDGGGIYIQALLSGSLLRMTNNVISGNVATDDGGGLYFHYNEEEDEDDRAITIGGGSVFTFEDNKLLANRAGGEGGGCEFRDHIDDGAAFFFNDNQINDNVSTGILGDESSDRGGGGCIIRSGFQDSNLVEITGNEFNRNTAAEDYGGLYIGDVDDGTEFKFWDNEVMDNQAGISATVVTGGDGAGLYIDNEEPDNLDDDPEGGSTLDIRDNKIVNNTAHAGAEEGGLYGGLYVALGTGMVLEMVDNTVEENDAGDSNAGVTVVMTNARLTLERNLIAANTAQFDAGGLSIDAGEGYNQYFLRRNTIRDNVAGATFAGGVRVENDGDDLWGESTNNLIAGNTGDGVGLYDAGWFGPNDTIAGNSDHAFAFEGSAPSTIVLLNDIVWDNAGGLLQQTGSVASIEAEYSDVQGGLLPGMGNLSVDPNFVGGGSFRLQQVSPAADVADTDRAPAVDLIGIPRPVGPEADMGCYERYKVGVTVDPDRASSNLPGTWAEYELTVTNDGAYADTFDLDAAISSLGWTAEVIPTSVNLDPGASQSIQARVYVPDDADEGDENEVTVRATSRTDSNIVDVALLETTAALAAGVSLVPDRSSTTVPGPVTYEHTLTNLGNGNDTFVLEAISDQGWVVTINPAVANLDSGEEATVQVTVQVPATAPQGTVDVTTVTATSQGDTSESDSAIDTTTSGVSGPPTVYLPVIRKNR